MKKTKRKTKKSIKRFSKKAGANTKTIIGNLMSPFRRPATIDAKDFFPLVSDKNQPRRRSSLKRIKNSLYQDISDENIKNLDFNVCAIYSNPIFLARPINFENLRDYETIDHVTPLRTICQEMKALSLSFKSENLKIFPAAEKKDIFKILQDISGFDPEILFITCHSYKNKILCEDEDGKIVVYRYGKQLYIPKKSFNNHFISEDEFVRKIKKIKKINNLKLLFLNACNMSNFAKSVSTELKDIYVICWNTDAEDVACLDFQKKLITEIKNINSQRKIYEDVYKNAAISFIKDYGEKYEVDRIQDPENYIRNPDQLRKIRPSGLNCLFKDGKVIDSLELIKKDLVINEIYKNEETEPAPPLEPLKPLKPLEALPQLPPPPPPSSSPLIMMTL